MKSCLVLLIFSFVSSGFALDLDLKKYGFKEVEGTFVKRYTIAKGKIQSLEVTVGDNGEIEHVHASPPNDDVWDREKKQLRIVENGKTIVIPEPPEETSSSSVNSQASSGSSVDPSVWGFEEVEDGVFHMSYLRPNNKMQYLEAIVENGEVIKITAKPPPFDGWDQDKKILTIISAPDGDREEIPLTGWPSRGYKPHIPDFIRGSTATEPTTTDWTSKGSEPTFTGHQTHGSKASEPSTVEGPVNPADYGFTEVEGAFVKTYKNWKNKEQTLEVHVSDNGEVTHVKPAIPEDVWDQVNKKIVIKEKGRNLLLIPTSGWITQGSTGSTPNLTQRSEASNPKSKKGVRFQDK